MIRKLTIEKLNKEYESYSKMDTPLRFGQYIYNEYTYEVSNSYNEKNINKVYTMLYESLVSKEE